MSFLKWYCYIIENSVIGYKNCLYKVINVLFLCVIGYVGRNIIFDGDYCININV